MSKQTIRNQIKNILSSIPCEQLKSESNIISRNIIQSKLYKTCTTLLAYMPLQDEVDITPVISDALNNKKDVFLPRITPGTNQMEFYRYTAASHLAQGSFGITEPEPDESHNFLNYLKSCGTNSPITTATITTLPTKHILMLVPGRAFTKDGRRLGRGKGFYDIYFSRLTALNFSEGIKKSGVCFACQLLADIPTTPDDVIMDNVYSSKS